MCTSPSFVWIKRGPEWEKVPAPCDLCWSCKENYVCDWVGRCLAEAQTSTVCCTLSLTYAPPKDPLDLSNRVINPHHFQLFMKRLRKAGHKVRYLVAGEYGDLRQRSHFHVILFFKLLKPSGQPDPVLMNRAAFARDPSIAHPLSRGMPQQDMCHIREWPHGHVVADWSASEKSVRYCCEYLHHAGKKNSWFSMSKKPPLGAEWFAEKAASNIDHGVMPSTFEYLPPGGRPGKVYLMTGATRRDYLNQIVTDRSARPRMSKWTAKTFDKLERQAFIDESTKPFDADAFLSRQMPLEKQASLLAMEDLKAQVNAEAFGKVLATAWGFDNVEEFEAFASAGGCENNPGAFRGFPGHVPGIPGYHSRPFADGAFKRSAKSPPTRFDRQGRPQWGVEGAEYIAAAFARQDDEWREPEDGSHLDAS